MVNSDYQKEQQKNKKENTLKTRLYLALFFCYTVLRIGDEQMKIDRLIGIMTILLLKEETAAPALA